ncbi:peptidase S41 [Roseomonas eburnea]|uniref:Peptidase S41 n=1 Tax=Neoroseomonas eburnea TaxID=1346889 RepID=A0A9X9XG02_9PROT|nr:S41 family peptidase [Neoroseomonas eburnea]MBR0682638.1 peptidase S41 [Neoroseomonas eburnea]
MLDDFLARRTPLCLNECDTLVSEAIKVLEGLYVHLPPKRALYAVDPVRRLRLLAMRIRRKMEANGVDRGASLPDDMWFHRELSEIMTSMRDLHTMYVLPAPFDQAIAFLPFQIEGCIENGEHRYLVSNIIDGLSWFSAPQSFERGVVVTHWNNVPIDRAVELSGERNAGSNPEARRARGVARLTMRPLAKSPPPDDARVALRYLARDGSAHELVEEWRVAEVEGKDDLPVDGRPIVEALDYEIDQVRLLRRENFSRLAQRSRKPASEKTSWLRQDRAVSDEDGLTEVDTMLPGVFRAAKLRTEEGLYGYIRIYTFQTREKLVDEFIRLLGVMPEDGLIIDIRDNPGGLVAHGECILQTLTPRHIQPAPAQFISTPLTAEFCRRLPAFGEWSVSVERALETGATYSAAFPMTAPVFANAIGQRYQGPVVLIVNALSYSTSDIFAAGFQDHGIGAVLGTDGLTGAGGAQVITHSELHNQFPDAEEDWPLGTLVAGRGDIRFALRRTLRVGELNPGMELEDRGVEPDDRYTMSRSDVLGRNLGLLQKAAAMLGSKKEERYCLKPAGPLKRDAGIITAPVSVRGIDRLDVLLDGWASASLKVTGDTIPIVATLPPEPWPNPTTLQLRGYRRSDGKLVAAWNEPLPDDLFTTGT